MSRSRTYRKKHKDLKEQQLRYLDYLENNTDVISIDFRLKLINEIAGITIEIKWIENLNLIQLESPVTEWEMEVTSKSIRNGKHKVLGL